MAKVTKATTEKVALFNENVQLGENIFFEQYKLYVETTNQTSERRGTTNSFFITIHTSIISFVIGILEFAQQNTTPSWLLMACFLGIFLALAWFLILAAYRNLNSARYNVIQEIETKLPLNIYKKEWELALKKGTKRPYVRLTFIEQLVPLGFLIFYLIMFAFIYPK